MLNHASQIDMSVETAKCVHPNPTVARSLLFASIPPGFTKLFYHSDGAYTSQISLITADLKCLPRNVALLEPCSCMRGCFQKHLLFCLPLDWLWHAFSVIC